MTHYKPNASFSSLSDQLLRVIHSVRNNSSLPSLSCAITGYPCSGVAKQSTDKVHNSLVPNQLLCKYTLIKQSRILLKNLAVLDCAITNGREYSNHMHPLEISECHLNTTFYLKFTVVCQLSSVNAIIFMELSVIQCTDIVVL